MSETKPTGILLSVEEYDTLVERAESGEQAKLERERLQATLQVALGKLEALEVSLQECERLRDDMLNSA